MPKPTRFDEPTGPDGQKCMTIRCATGRGDVPAICFGTFTMRFNQTDVLFCVNNEPGTNKLGITEYRSGLRWPVELYEPSGWDLGLDSPTPDSDPELQRVVTKAKGLMATRLNDLGDHEVERIILSQHKRYKTNEWDF